MSDGVNVVVKNTFLEVSGPRMSVAANAEVKRNTAPGLLEQVSEITGQPRVINAGRVITTSPQMAPTVTVTNPFGQPITRSPASSGSVSFMLPEASSNGSINVGVTRTRILSGSDLNSPDSRRRILSNVSDVPSASPRSRTVSFCPETPEYSYASSPYQFNGIMGQPMPFTLQGGNGLVIASAVPLQLPQGYPQGVTPQLVQISEMPPQLQAQMERPFVEPQQTFLSQQQGPTSTMSSTSRAPIRLSQVLPNSGVPIAPMQQPAGSSTSGVLYSGEGNETSLMIRNIPNKYTREMLLEDLDMNGFKNLYDFFYLPIDFRTQCNMGYAFVNLVTVEDANRLRSLYGGRQLSAYNSAKICEVGAAKVQGKDRNVDQYRNSAVMSMDERYHPLVFENGVRVPFPKPTTAIKPFRLRPNRAGPPADR